MKKILVLGAGGMAGHVISLHLREQGYNVDTLSANKALDDKTILIDVMNKGDFDNILEQKTYDVIINCIGILVKQSEDRKDLSTYLNAFLPHYLENKYKSSKTKIIHLSTDCVFSGKNGPYDENSVFDGELYYDRTKALGEINNDKDLTLRMSIIGPDMQEGGTGLFNWFFSQTGEISGYKNAIWNGVTTIELAKGVESAIFQDLIGLYHLVPRGNISKYDLVKLFADIFERKDISVVPDYKISVDKTLKNTRNDFDFEITDYNTMLQDMKNWINSHQALYPHYMKEII